MYKKMDIGYNEVGDKSMYDKKMAMFYILDILREYIVQRYKKLWNMDITIDNVIITTGSQQALDLIGKVSHICC